MASQFLIVFDSSVSITREVQASEHLWTQEKCSRRLYFTRRNLVYLHFHRLHDFGVIKNKQESSILIAKTGALKTTVFRISQKGS